LQCAKAQVAGLSGIRAKADASLYDGDRFIHKESGEIQFTDYGLSGIAVMQLSGYLSPHSGIRKPEIRLDLFPHLTEDALTALLRGHGCALPQVSAGDFMTGLIHRRLGLAVWKAQKLGDEKRLISTLTEAEWAKLARGFKAWRFTDLENTGWKNAQTTGGGTLLHQLEPHTFMLKNAPGVYIVGETTDCAGSCGGFNLHWAFGSGILAGEAAARQLGGKPSAAPHSPTKAAPAAPKHNRQESSRRGEKSGAKPAPKHGAPARRPKTDSRTKDGRKAVPKPANHKKHK
jgi:predicted flavoprotein YhiN